MFASRQQKISERGERERGELPGGPDSADNKLCSAFFFGLCAHGSPAWTDLALLAPDSTEFGGKCLVHRAEKGGSGGDGEGGRCSS